MLDKNTQDIFDHDDTGCIGVLLTNLGTPDSCETADVRRYLKEFLWDPRVVEVSRPVWWFVLNVIILNTRPKRSAAAYKKIWTSDGSPLLTVSRSQQQALQAALDTVSEVSVKVALAMRYGNPSIASGLEELRQAGARQIVVLPLYPQYSASTTASTFDEVSRVLQGWRWVPELSFIQHYHDQPAYIEALADSVRKHWAENGQAEKLVMSFHGIPQEYFLNGDPYYCECQKTGRLLAEKLGLEQGQWQLTFQSRLGKKEWLRPYTDQTLEEMGRSAVKSIDMICPGFSADCLETLEEIAMENRDIFLGAGGEQYSYIPCLNESQPHIEMMATLVRSRIECWLPK